MREYRRNWRGHKVGSKKAPEPRTALDGMREHRESEAIGGENRPDRVIFMNKMIWPLRAMALIAVALVLAFVVRSQSVGVVDTGWAGVLAGLLVLPAATMQNQRTVSRFLLYLAAGVLVLLTDPRPNTVLVAGIALALVLVASAIPPATNTQPGPPVRARTYLRYYAFLSLPGLMLIGFVAPIFAFLAGAIAYVWIISYYRMNPMQAVVLTVGAGCFLSTWTIAIFLPYTLGAIFIMPFVSFPLGILCTIVGTYSSDEEKPRWIRNAFLPFKVR